MAISPPLEKSTDILAYSIWRLSVEQYHKMIEAGILTADDPVELLEGLLIIKMTKNRGHSVSTRRTRKALERITPSGWYVDSQEPITTADSEPEPDAIVVREEVADITDRQPMAEEVALVVEVSDATLQKDRTLKLRLYARAGIPWYWIVNLQDDLLEVYSDPILVDEPTYRQRTIYHPSDEVPVIIDGKEFGRLKVSDLLP